MKKFLIGLTESDMIRLNNGGQITVNPNTVGMPDFPIVIFKVMDEHEAVRIFNSYPDTVAKAVDSHTDEMN